MDSTHGLVLFNSTDEKIRLPVSIDHDSVWLNRTQMAELFGRDVKTIGKHISNAIQEELANIPTVAKFATVQTEGVRQIQREIEYYNLDVIISVGYRVKSARGVEFRRWANDVLKSYILKGHAVNNDRLKQLGQMISFLKRSEVDLDASQILSVVSSYTKALDLLTEYDNDNIKKPLGRQAIKHLTYEACRNIINQIKPCQNNHWFGVEKDDSFQSSINTIFQTFNGQDLYQSLEEKAANLLYFIAKNHSFTDGNKRIAATIFLHFLAQNNALFHDEQKIIDDHTLVAITILVAASRPHEKELMINLIMTMIA